MGGLKAGQETKQVIRRVPSQKRSREKYDAILRACGQMLREEGFERTTTAKVAARAGVGKGVLYQYFPNREILVATFVETEVNSLLTRTIAAGKEAANRAPLEMARTLLHMNIQFWMRNRKLLKVVLNEVPGVFELPGIRRFERRIAEFTGSLVDLGSERKRPADLERKLYVLTNVVSGFIIRLALMDPAGASADELTEELMTMLEGYVDRSGLGEWIATTGENDRA